MIRHTVVFKLKHAQGSLQEKAFLRDTTLLGTLPGVQKFERLKQVSPKNDYEFGISMEFEDQTAYAAYKEHPKHKAFVRDRWSREIERSLEIDYQAI